MKFVQPLKRARQQASKQVSDSGEEEDRGEKEWPISPASPAPLAPLPNSSSSWPANSWAHVGKVKPQLHLDTVQATETR